MRNNAFKQDLSIIYLNSLRWNFSYITHKITYTLCASQPTDNCVAVLINILILLIFFINEARLNAT